MSELAALTGEDVYLVVADGTRAVCIERIEGKTPVRVMALDVGRSFPLHVGGGPVALLAARETELLPGVIALWNLDTSGEEMFDESSLRERLEDVRQRGYSRSLEDVTPGIGALGAAIFDARGTAVGALSVAGMLGSLLEHEEELAEALQVSAARISSRLGHQPR
ncbi:hypothetical protein M4I32_04790 [Microbacterium sp. LRZ72]|uniref:IclR family transcriptional regulator n=1 Tax=Microbacterium sp. LRZ72 TaxID=2942481 RepID=UPI0029B42685|nr:IclR family transcriptional regulator C-terminal domain-containing protein [Microbacterium sp. LRZ72]MDX2376114.1 hypothetical protein [Microbacterium sp. LRZ72]